MDRNADSAPPTAPLIRPAAPRAPRTLSLLANLRVGQKLGLTALAFSLPVAALLTLLVSQQQTDIDFARREQAGLTALKPLSLLQENIAEFVDSTTEKNTARAQQAEDTVNRTVRTLNTSLTRQGFTKSVVSLKALDTSWKYLTVQSPTQGGLDIVLQFQRLQNGQLSAYVTDLLDEAGLILDPKSASYFMMDGTILQLSRLRASLRTIYMLIETSERLGEGAPQQAQVRQEIYIQTLFARQALAAASADFRRATAVDAVLKAKYGQQLDNLTAIGPFLEFAQAIRADQPVSSMVSAKQAESTVAVVDQVFANGSAALGGLIQQRLDGLYQRRTLSLLLVGVVVALALVLLTLIARSITSALSGLARASRRVAAGDLNVDVPVTSRDEIGVVAGAFNAAVAQLRQNEVKNQQEAERSAKLQHNIGDFLDVTMNIADGDLTQRGTVTDDALGNVVDSINLAVAEIESLLSQVRGVAGEVSQGAGDMAQTAQAAALEARQQAEGARRLTAQTGQVVGGIRFVAAEADQTRSAAARTLEASESGLEAVQRTGAGLERAQGVMQQVAQGVRELSQRSQDISEAVSAIANFSSQTSLLALGASLEAAGAGEAGRRFSVVARGVSDLAEESTGAAQRVERIIGGVQAQIQELVAQVETGVREVNAGTQVAQQAGAQLRQIAELAEQSARVSQGISEATQAQVQQVESVGASIEDIARGAARSEAQSALGQQVADRLTELVAQLSSQLGRFRLGA